MEDDVKKYGNPLTQSLLFQLSVHLRMASQEKDKVKVQARAKAVRNVLDSALHLSKTPLVVRQRPRGDTPQPPVRRTAQEQARWANELIEIKAARELLISRRTKLKGAFRALVDLP